MRLSLDTFLTRAELKHGHKYDYSLVKFENAKCKISIICPEHGEFMQNIGDHLSGSGCRICGYNKSSASLKKTLHDFIKDANLVHYNKYDYADTVYINDRTNVLIICEVHGKFSQTPNNHLRGQGCPVCGELDAAKKIKKPQDIFLKELLKIHGNKYDYSKVQYSTSHSKIIIICRHHGPFSQSAVHHLNGRGCPKCSPIISKMEIQWLDSLSIPQDYRHKTIFIEGTRLIVDAFDPVSNTIYEFYGDYWHGNPKKYKSDDINTRNKTTFGELYKKTIARREKILKHGYSIIEKWETE